MVASFPCFSRACFSGCRLMTYSLKLTSTQNRNSILTFVDLIFSEMFRGMHEIAKKLNIFHFVCSETPGNYDRISPLLGNLNDENQPSINSDYSQDCSPRYPLRYNDIISPPPNDYNERGLPPHVNDDRGLSTS